MRRHSLFLAGCAAALCALLPTTRAAAAAAGFDVRRPEIQTFIAEQARAGADAAALTALLASAVPQPKIVEAMEKPAEKSLQWFEYRARFLTEERISAGVALWREHRALLEAVEAREQVSPQHLLAIIGVETFYGRITGRYRVLDALATLAFDYPPRKDYFRAELGQFLKLCNEEKFDPQALLGSYAGAMGVAQFMPSSYRQYAINQDGSPARDLWHDWGDIFGSVAHYLHQYGWQLGAPVMAAARYMGDLPPETPASVTLGETVGKLGDRGFVIDTDLPADTPAVLVAAPEPDQAAWRVGFRNFYVITRYNRSPLYAMAVNDLAEAILLRFNQQ